MNKNRETKKARNQTNWFRAFLAGAAEDAFVLSDKKMRCQRASIVGA
jgi:hypothetical protein